MDTKRICPSCQKPIASDGPLGLCPECLVKSGLDTGPVGETAFTPPPIEEITRLFPQFEILGLIGRGGMGAVYKARQPKLDRLVALKVLPGSAANDPGFTERFDREARALARLNHPNIVAVYDFGGAGGLSFLVMEFVDGPNLREVGRTNRLTPQQALQVVPQICDALQFAHNEGIVHRDIKPENILLDKKGRVKIADFGIAKIISAQPDHLALTGGKDVIGTPHYMAPEQLERPQSVDHRADIFSLGVVFYELLTGELPLGRFAPPSQKVQVDVRLDEVVLRTLEKEPERRYQQASQVKTAVETIASSPRRIVRPPATPPPVAKDKSPSSKMLFAGAGGVGCLVVAVAAIVWFSKKAPDSKTESPKPNTTAPVTSIEPVLARSPETRLVDRRELLADLNSPSVSRQRLALSRLANTEASEPKEEMCRALTNVLTAAEWPVRQLAARALANWGTADALPALRNALADSEFSVRWAAIETVSHFKDVEAGPALAQLLCDESCAMKAHAALVTIGPTAEDAVLKILTQREADCQRNAIRVLKEIGTRNSLATLTPFASNTDGSIAMLAREAIQTIELRERIKTSLKPKP